MIREEEQRRETVERNGRRRWRIQKSGRERQLEGEKDKRMKGGGKIEGEKER